MKTMSETEYRRQPALLERVQGRIVGIGRIEESAVLDAYRRWAPVYDHTFGLIAREGRRHAVEVINARDGRVLEVGVGTGLSLPDYEDHLEVVGIDLSPEMLEKARERVATGALDHVTGLHEMDAGDLRFPDASFDTVVAMYVMTVVPEPEQVMRELVPRDQARRRGDAGQPLQPARGRARLGGAAHGAVRRPHRLALGVRRLARDDLRRPGARREEVIAAVRAVHDAALQEARGCRPPDQGRVRQRCARPTLTVSDRAPYRRCVWRDSSVG